MSKSYYVLTSNSELCHYGVKGMKWGVRRTPEQLGHQNRSNKQSTLKSTISVSQKVKSFVQRTKYLRDMNAIKNGKKAADDALYRIGSKYLQPFDQNREEVELWEYSDGSREFANPSKMIKDFGSSLYNKGYLGITDDDVRAVNPDYGQPGTTNNCTKCSAALELRKRGMDVRAGRQTYPASGDAFTHWFKDAVREEYLFEEAETSIKNNGPGSSGALLCFYPKGIGGHAMHWSVSDNGDFRIEDGQSGRSFSSLKDVTAKYGFLDAIVHSYRLDNCEPNYDNLLEDSVIRGPSDRVYGVRNKSTGVVSDTW